MKQLWLISLLFTLNLASAQEFADTKFYLVDSLVLEELPEGDRTLLKEVLTTYHKATTDTGKIAQLNIICENMMYDDWTKYQWLQYRMVKAALEKPQDAAVKHSLQVSMAGALNNIGIMNMAVGNIDKALEYYLKSLAIQEEIGDQMGIVSSLNNIGSLYDDKGELDQARRYFVRAIQANMELKDLYYLGFSYNGLGQIYHFKGNIPKALTYHHRALTIRKEVGDKQGEAYSYNNLAAIYRSQKNYKQALEYIINSQKIQHEIGDLRGEALCFNNIGIIYSHQGKNKEALDQFRIAQSIRLEIRDKKGLAYSLSCIGAEYLALGDEAVAMEFYEQCLALREELGDKNGIAAIHIDMGWIHYHNGKLNLAKKHGDIAYGLAQGGHSENLRDAAKFLSEVYESKGNGNKAFKLYKEYVLMKDSIINEDNQQTTIQRQAQYEYEVKKAVDDAETEKQLAIGEEKQSRQRVVIYAVVAVSLLIAFVLFFVFNRLRLTRKQKHMIETAHNELEEKNQEIMDSITYAKRIQSAILPPEKVVKEYLEESFILYKPKDIVAGDFYWMEHKDGRILFAAADCTGHGVPGAMVSVVCNNGLNRSVREHGLIDPGKILDKTREIVVQEFEKSEEEVKDGMDIALCSLEGNTLLYAGAHNPLWIIRNGEIIETKANKQPIGKFTHAVPFTTHRFELEPNDTLYIFSDGFIDQFGGPKGKKLKAKAFREMLLRIQKLSMEEQKQTIDREFEAWKGDLEQIDDVCVIGVRV